MSPGKRHFLIANLVTLVTAIVLAFQACGGKLKFEGIANKSSNNSGNGGSYGGKPGAFVNFDSMQPCDTGADGSPLPNNQINIAAGVAEKVRSGCSDLTPPQQLSLNDIQVSGNGITYQGEDFSDQAPLPEFSVVAATCPAPLNPIMNATRTNLLSSSQSLVAPDWTVMLGVTSILEGTIAGLDGFRITRTNLNGWERIKQVAPLTAGRLYSLSVLVRHGSGTVARLEFEQPAGSAFSAALDTSNGSSVLQSNIGFSQVSITSRLISDAYFFTIYFSPNASLANGDFGVSTNQVVVGDSIFATAVQLEEVNSYCSP